MPKSNLTDAYWNDFCAATGHTGTRYDVAAFGDSPAMIDELGQLVLSGQKRATAGLLRDFADDEVPKAGDFVVVVDGEGNPICIYCSTEVRIGPLISVDERFAWDEGEGDKSRAWWLKAHQEFFSRQAQTEGFSMHDDIATVFERFSVVWPPEAADR